MAKRKYRNVSWHKIHKLWRVKLRANGREHNIGYYKDQVVAAKVADCAAHMLKGAEAVYNFDGKPPDSVPEANILDKLLKQGVPIGRLYLKWVTITL